MKDCGADELEIVKQMRALPKLNLNEYLWLIFGFMQA